MQIETEEDQGLDPDNLPEGMEISEGDLVEPDSSSFWDVDLSQIDFLVQPDEWIGVETLRTMYHPSNSQVRDPNELVAIQRSLKKNGMAGALIVVNRWNQKVLGGHGKIEAAYQGGYRGDLPVVYMDIPSETDHRLRMLQLNMATGHQDEEMQRREVQYLLDLLPATEVLPDLAMTEQEMIDLLGISSNADPIDAKEEWQGMPEFEQEDAFGAVRSIKVHFATQEDVEAFADLIQQTITEGTKFLWFPKQKNLDLINYRCVDEP